MASNTTKISSKTLEQEKKYKGFNNHLLKNVYKGVKVPWGPYILEGFLALIIYFLTGQAATYTVRIATGEFETMDVILYVVFTMCTWISNYVAFRMDKTSVYFNGRQKKRLWNKIMHLPVEEFDKDTPDKLLSRVVLDTDNTSAPFSLATTIIAVLALCLGVLSGAGESLSNPMAGFLLAGLAVGVVGIVISTILMAVSGFKMNNRLANMTAHLAERFANMRLIKASCAEKEEIKKAFAQVDEYYRATIDYVKSSCIYTIATYSLVILTDIGAYLYGAELYAQGDVTFTTIYTFAAYGTSMSTFFLIFGSVVAAFAYCFGGSTDYAKLYDIIDEDTTSGKAMVQQPENIVGKDISFAYGQSQPVLKNVSFEIEKGKITAIVGANGSGKSTLIKLIDRLYNQPNGKMYIGNQDANEISLESWRSKFGIVSQNASLFTGTIRENICYGLTNVSEQRLNEVIKTAGIEDIIASHAEGLEFNIGVGAANISGGEAQRIAIARALMKDPQYLILDEATANLDSKTEKQVQQGIDKLMENRTVIVIAHNYSSIKNAHKIIALEKGEIVGCGTHDELIRICPFYKRIVDAGFEA